MHQASVFKLKFYRWCENATYSSHGAPCSARDLFPCLITILKVHYISMDNTRISERHSSYHSDSRDTFIPLYYISILAENLFKIPIKLNWIIVASDKQSVTYGSLLKSCPSSDCRVSLLLAQHAVHSHRTLFSFHTFINGTWNGTCSSKMRGWTGG